MCVPSENPKYYRLCGVAEARWWAHESVGQTASSSARQPLTQQLRTAVSGSLGDVCGQTCGQARPALLGTRDVAGLSSRAWPQHPKLRCRAGRVRPEGAGAHRAGLGWGLELLSLVPHPSPSQPACPSPERFDRR